MMSDHRTGIVVMLKAHLDYGPHTGKVSSSLSFNKITFAQAWMHDDDWLGAPIMLRRSCEEKQH